MNSPFFSTAVYRFLFALLGLVYLIGLFVPLMDNDSAHHANIALHMYLTGDYVNLVDYGKDYLDKPHLHFWLASLSYHIFGVTTFAYKFPSLLFTILGTYSTYRLGKTLYDKETGKLSALLIASAFAYILANNDVRMDAILTACIAFATWQLVEMIQHKKLINVGGAALGLALGFCTKGHIAVFTPAVAAGFYILYLKDWKFLISWKWLLLVALFALFITPVVYCYYLQYNLHPEKIVRDKDHINGVNFILFNQSVERFGGGMGNSGKNDYFFFIHSFLWAFAPWSIIAYIAFFFRLKTFFSRKQEWLTTGVLATMLIIISLSGFKLPHYLNITFPAASVMTACFILSKRTNTKWVKSLYTIQLVLSFILLAASAVINAWAFPVSSFWILVCVIGLLSLIFYFIKSSFYSTVQKAVLVSVSSVVFTFFLLNKNFYPQLLSYQAGNELAFNTKNIVDPADVYFWKDHYSSSYSFYTATLRKPFTDSTFQNGKKIWLLADSRSLQEIKEAGYILGKSILAKDYEITRLKLKFINPATRDKQLLQMVLVQVIGYVEQPI